MYMTTSSSDSLYDALDLCASNNFERALAIADQNLASEPTHEIATLAHRVRGHALMGMGQLDEAIDETNLALQANPNDVEILAFRSLIYRRQGDIDAAERDSGRALEIDPENVQAMGEVAIVALINQDYDRVIDLSTIVLDSDEDDNEPLRADAYSWRAQAHLRLGDASEAMEDINMAIKTWPDNSSIYCGIRSDIHMADGNPGDAIGDIEMALARQPADPDLLFRKGRTLGALACRRQGIPSPPTCARCVVRLPASPARRGRRCRRGRSCRRRPYRSWSSSRDQRLPPLPASADAASSRRSCTTCRRRSPSPANRTKYSRSNALTDVRFSSARSRALRSTSSSTDIVRLAMPRPPCYTGSV